MAVCPPTVNLFCLPYCLANLARPPHRGENTIPAPTHRKTCAVPTHDDLSLEAYGYDLPQELIAQRPIEPRDSSRLMVVHRGERRFEHRVFTDLLEYLRPGDVMVFNDSRVFPARMYGVRVDTGAKIELLLLRRQSPGVWHTLARPGRRMTPGTTFELRGGTVAVQGEVLEAHDDGSRTVRLSERGAARRDRRLCHCHRIFRSPLKTRKGTRPSTLGSEGVSQRRRRDFTLRSVSWREYDAMESRRPSSRCTLDGPRFAPCRSRKSRTTTCTPSSTVSSETWAQRAINRAKRERRRVIAVGTTTVRLLEYAASLGGGGKVLVRFRRVRAGPISSFIPAIRSGWSTRSSRTFTCRNRRCSC